MTELSKMNNVRRIHCLGIGGAGMSGLAEILQARGYDVTGSDLVQNQVTTRLTRLGIPISFQCNDCLISQADILVYSSAIPFNHPERQWAQKKEMPCFSRGQMLKLLIEGYTSIAVAGTHGKTTTVGLIAQLLHQADLDPTIIIGGYLNHIRSNATFGRGEYLVAEADESDRSLLLLKPSIAVLTQIDKDHLEHYHYDFQSLINTYRRFIEQTQDIAILCHDDPILCSMINHGLSLPVLSYGFQAPAMIRGIGFYQSSHTFTLTILREKVNQSTLTVTVPLLGQYNAYNVLAAVAVATYLKMPSMVIQKGLKNYQGVARRLELLGEIALPQGSVKIMDDYGHHPREIAVVTQAVRQAFPKRRLVLIFQPHRYTRTRDLLEEFAEVLAYAADCLFLLPVYAAHEPSIAGINHFVLADAIRKKGGQPILVELFELHQVLQQFLMKDDIVLFQGAGNVGQIAKEFKATWTNSEESLKRECP